MPVNHVLYPKGQSRIRVSYVKNAKKLKKKTGGLPNKSVDFFQVPAGFKAIHAR
jgi:hypothetical protein